MGGQGLSCRGSVGKSMETDKPQTKERRQKTRTKPQKQQSHRSRHFVAAPPRSPGQPRRGSLTQKMKLKPKSRYLMHLVPPLTGMAAAGGQRQRRREHLRPAPLLKSGFPLPPAPSLPGSPLARPPPRPRAAPRTGRPIAGSRRRPAPAAGPVSPGCEGGVGWGCEGGYVCEGCGGCVCVRRVCGVCVCENKKT